MTNRCSIPGCRGEVEIVYLGHGVCQPHWDRFTAEDQPAGALAKALGIPVAMTATREEPMGAEETKEAAAKSKKPKTARKAKAAKAPKAPRPKKERTEPVPDRVFAIRVTTPELEAIHKAAGPRNASHFVRRIVAAFAAENVDDFKTVIAEARKLRE